MMHQLPPFSALKFDALVHRKGIRPAKLCFNNFGRSGLTGTNSGIIGLLLNIN